VTDDATSDGRRLRGARKRTEIVTATLRVIERDGVAGVTHRTVAKEAGTTPSSVNYHFSTLDDLLVAALTTAVDEYATQLDAIRSDAEDPLAALAQLIADAGGAGRARAIAERELTLLAARRPALRPAAQRWRGLVGDLAGELSEDPLAGDALMAASDGICTRVLLGDATFTHAQIHTHLRRAVGLTEVHPA
jgi:TetR/AcrR family transcriptional regulator, regulator of biofilm formation and stress response